jgi:hypothetical protein
LIPLAQLTAERATSPFDSRRGAGQRRVMAVSLGREVGRGAVNTDPGSDSDERTSSSRTQSLREIPREFLPSYELVFEPLTHRLGPSQERWSVGVVVRTDKAVPGIDRDRCENQPPVGGIREKSIARELYPEHEPAFSSGNPSGSPLRPNSQKIAEIARNGETTQRINQKQDIPTRSV